MARCGQKRKSVDLKALELTSKIARISNAPKLASALIMQATKTQIVEDKIMLEL
jgi:hypothetical protein